MSFAARIAVKIVSSATSANSFARMPGLMRISDPISRGDWPAQSSYDPRVP